MKADALAMEIFEITKKIPSEEKYELTYQTRRFSRAEMENTEPQVSLEFAKTCKYISQKEYRELRNNSKEVSRMLNHMVKNPEKYNLKQ